MFGGGSVVPLVKSGKLRALAVSSAKRSSVLPDLPTIAEFYPGYEVNDLAGPVRADRHAAGDHRQAARRSERGAGDAGRGAEAVAAGSGEPNITTPEEFDGMIRGDYEKYGIR